MCYHHVGTFKIVCVIMFKVKMLQQLQRLVCWVVVFWGIAWVGGVSHITTAAATTGGGIVTTSLAMKPVVIIGN